jgi:putative YhbY family RNA-binding protein
MQKLSPAEQQALRARAHGLNPVVMVSENGLSDAVIKEIDRSLKAHELIKIRVFGDDRDERTALLGQICAKLEAAPVQLIGKVLVVYRKNPEPIKPSEAPRTRRPAPASSGRPAGGRRRKV